MRSLAKSHRRRTSCCRVVHRFVACILMTPDPTLTTIAKYPERLVTAITERVNIRLEYEPYYDWMVFLPQHESDAGEWS